MKKVGLLTFHFPLNYGAFLQTFGLQEYVKGRGHDIEIINYYTDSHMRRFDFWKKPSGFKELIFLFVKSLFFRSYLKKKKKFKSFSDNRFSLTARYSELEDVSFDYDIVLTGSDQVFNINHFDRLIYFQPFKKREGQLKTAYAPSFGINELNDEISTRIENYIQDFDFLSCREKSGKDFLSKISDINVEHVLDPVFLLSSEEWSSISSQRLIKEKYIFIYDLNGKKPLVDKAKELANGRKIAIISNDPIASLRSSYSGCDIFIKSAGIEDFISLVKYSDFVITDSFHGTAMSILFNKDFYTFIALKSASMRIYSLLSLFSLESRIFDKDSINEVSLDNDIKNYDLVLNQLIHDSKKYLNQFL